jgi:hypothetical protein
MGKEVEVYQEPPNTLDGIVETINTPEFNNEFFDLTEGDLPDIPINPNPSYNEHVPTKTSRLKVRLMKIAGIDNDMISATMGVSPELLAKHYKKDLETGLAECTALVAGKLVEKIRNGDNACIIFYLRTRGRWAPKNELEITHTHINKPRTRLEIIEELKLLGIPEDKIDELSED